MGPYPGFYGGHGSWLVPSIPHSSSPDKLTATVPVGRGDVRRSYCAVCIPPGVFQIGQFCDKVSPYSFSPPSLVTAFAKKPPLGWPTPIWLGSSARCTFLGLRLTLSHFRSPQSGCPTNPSLGAP